MTSKSIAIAPNLHTFPTFDSVTVPFEALRPSRWLDRYRHHALRQRLEQDVVAAPKVVLGTSEIPFEAFEERASWLDSLAHRAGVAVTVVTRGGLQDQAEAALLAKLDLDHVVSLELHLDTADAPARFDVLRSAARFADLGLAVRIVLGQLDDSSSAGGALADLVARAARLGVVDVAVREASSSPKGSADRGQTELYRLRLQHGLPRAMAGRG